MRTVDTSLVSGGATRAAGWLIAIAGVVPAIIITYFMTGTDVAKDPKGYADAATSVIGLGAGYLYLLALIGLIFGLFALYASVATERNSRLALAGLIFSVAGVGFLMAVFGTTTLGGAVAADAYRGDHPDAAAIMQKLSGGSFGHALLDAMVVALVLSLIGAILFGTAIWRSSSLPGWSGVLFALGFVLLVVTVPVATQIGGILLLVAGVRIARFEAAGLPASQAGVPQPA